MRLVKITPFVPCSSLSRQVAFYRDILGFQVGFLADTYAFLKRDEAAIRLVEVSPDVDFSHPEQQGSFYIDVKGIDSLYHSMKNKLEKLPAGRVRAPFDQSYGQREFHIINEDCTLVFFGEPVAGSGCWPTRQDRTEFRISWKVSTMHRVGIIPFATKGDQIALLFVTSQTRGRWILPKGRIKAKETHLDACHREAFEEAGVRGTILEDFPFTTVIGKYGPSGVQQVAVTYYPFLVNKQENEWPEKERRLRHWALREDAPKVAYREDYLGLIEQFASLKPWVRDAVSRDK